MKQITGLDLNASDGRVSRGNLYPTDREQLELVTEEMPTETLYLKGFSGGDYEGGEWQEDRDEEIYALMEENSLHWGRWESWIPGIYESLYYVMNHNMRGMEESASDRVLAVRYLNGWRGDWYAPYYSMWSRSNQRYAEDLYGFRYFQQEEMDIRWDNIQTYFADNGDMYQEVQTAYEKEAVEIYTQVPVEEIPRLTKLCRENPMEDLDHITSFILYTLQSNTSYTRTPGMFPFNEDPVEYFLFQGKEGYCQHFASAAVLMYRLYGIPARYASGYVVSPSDFEQQEDGTWRAVVTDVSAHAWPEIFIHDYGWTPVEVTPSGNGDSVHYPGFDAQIFQDIVADREWNMAVPSLQNREQEEEEEEVQEAENAGSLPETGWKSSGKLAGFGGAALAVLCVILYRSYKRRDLWIQKGGMGRLFDQLLFDLHFSGRMESYQGWEEDLGQKLAEEEFKKAAEGKELMARRLKNWKMEMSDEDLGALIKKYSMKSINEFYCAVAENAVDIYEVKSYLSSKDREQEARQQHLSKEKAEETPVKANEKEPKSDVLVIGGNIGNIGYRMAKCCHPVFGDDVFGFISVRDGITIHRVSCPNAARLIERYPYRIQRVRWSSNSLSNSFQTTLRVLCRGEKRLGAPVMEAVSQYKASVRSMVINERNSRDVTHEIELKLSVPNNLELDKVISQISNIKSVMRVKRV